LCEIPAIRRAPMAGYSGTPLVKKLGIKPDTKIIIKNEPTKYTELVTDIPDNVSFCTKWQKDLDFAHIFSKKRSEVFTLISEARNHIKPNGVIWVSWPKKASKVLTDITEDIIRDYALKTDLVDIKVCAVDETWSGLKLVVRKENR